MVLVGNSSINGEFSIGMVPLSEGTRNLWEISWVLYVSFELHIMCHGQAAWVNTGSHHTLKLAFFFHPVVNGGMTIPELAASSSPTFDHGIPGLKGLHDSIWKGAWFSTFWQPDSEHHPKLEVAKNGTRRRLHNATMDWYPYAHSNNF